jgi:secreted PhoX family phosphatase
VGGPYDGGATGDKCSVDNIAQPDNLFVMNDGRLLIGEDSGNHVNNMLWLYTPNAAE